MSETNVDVDRRVGGRLPLDALVTAAVQLAGGDAVVCGGRLWQSEGGRGCPLGWGGCSQAVYVDLKTGEYDYGDPGGPGHADCVRHCKHGMQPCEDEDADLPLWETLEDDDWAEPANAEFSGE